MGEVFKPWRRKFGALMLMAAVFVTFIWERSHVTVDSAVFSICGRTHHLFCLDGQIYWWSLDGVGNELSISSKKMNVKARAADLPLVRMQFERLHLKEWIVPCWSFFLPLTLLSAYLMLSRPLAAKPKPAGEPILPAGA
jgi:hypothetical protein